jgi:2-polyprenyl-3-methyl-5-hydroxy-6-metoxy-1,4-benzoquinol methylase
MAPNSSDSIVEVSLCPMCGGGRFTTGVQEPPYSVRRCARCGQVWVSPRLTEEGLHAIYAHESYWRSDSPRTVGYRDYRSDERLYLKTFRRRLGFSLAGVPRRGRALDVGCAAGFCMKVLSELGFEAHGVEPSAEIARHARERFGFETVHVGPLESLDQPAGSFDVITMWDVVEHVIDPRGLLARARELLKPDGALVLETQNVDSAFARLLGRRWHHYKHGEHIYHFTPATVHALATSAGFRVEKLTPRFAGKYVTFDFIAERAARLHPALSLALRPLATLGSASVYCNFMDEMIVVARPVGASADASAPRELSSVTT